MLEEIFFPRTAKRYRAAPLVEQRERYLVHLGETGAERSTLRKCANDQLSLVRLLKLKKGARVRLSQIEVATAIWSRPKGRRCHRSASSKAKARFVTHAVRWLRFLGWLDEPEREHHPHHAKIAIFEKWLRQERGLSTATIQDYCRATDHFFCRLAGKGILLLCSIAHKTDAATGQHGDLLDVIQLSRGLAFSDAVEEARRFLSLPPPAPDPVSTVRRRPAPVGLPEAARRLWAISHGIAGTRAQSYLADRGITHIEDLNSLRFHPRCYYRPDDHGPTETWPGLIAAVTDLGHRITGVHRTWLNPDGFDPIRLGKAPIDTPRRAIGDLLGHAVRFGAIADVAAAGEGIETMLSLRMVLPAMPMLSALSAAHLAAILFPPTLRRLYVACDDDPAGDAAHDTLRDRAHQSGIDVIPLSPQLADINDELRLVGISSMRAAVRIQLVPQDVARFRLVADRVR
jgi:Toprim domain